MLKIFEVHYGGPRQESERIVLDEDRKVVGGKHLTDNQEKHCGACGRFYNGRECNCDGRYIPSGYGDWEHDRENGGRVVFSIPEDWQEVSLGYTRGVRKGELREWFFI